MFSTLGNLVGQGADLILGMGDYDVVSQTPTANTIAGTPAPPPPAMHIAAGGTIRVSHREFLGDLKSGQGENAARDQYVLNPFDAKTFPYLHQIARLFTRWRALGIAFEYRPTCGDAISSTNNALGTVAMATQYNVLEAAFSSKTQILNHFWSQSAKPTLTQLHMVECAPGVTPNQPLYVRNSYLGTVDETKALTYQEAADPRLYDHGRFEYFINGQQLGGVTIGELWITYDIELFMPKLDTTGLSGFTFDAPPSVLTPMVANLTHSPEVPLVQVLPIDDAEYPDHLDPVDSKEE